MLLSQIKMIFEKYSTGLFTLEEVRRLANEKGLSTRNGKPISKQNISKIIRNKFYYGIMTKKGVEQKGNHEPLISETTFYKCQKLLRSSGDKAYLPESKKSEDFPLRHFAICGHCGQPLTASYSRGKSGKRFPLLPLL